MFLRIVLVLRMALSFPRVSGDVSRNLTFIFPFTQFSPRERGCFLEQAMTEQATQVFPA